MKFIEFHFSLLFNHRPGFRTPFGKAMSRLNDKTEHSASWGFTEEIDTGEVIGVHVDVLPHHNVTNAYRGELRNRFMRLLCRWEKKGAIVIARPVTNLIVRKHRQRFKQAVHAN